MKQILIVFLALVTSFVAMSRTLTPEEALARVQMSRSDIRFAPKQYKNPKLVYTQDVASGDIPAVYIFNNGDNGGYMVLSANDAVTPMLGYSDNGNIDPDNLPENFRWWIEEYARQIEWADQHPAQAMAEESSRATDFDPIEPLCQTKWNQDYPYNISTPYVKGEHCVTGCVATAMAQVMKYHNWPPKGFGEHSYDWNGTTLSKAFGNVTFEWKKMYSSHTQYTTNAAVARLMNACGISVDMDYGVNESGAYSSLIPEALFKYFNYDFCRELIKDNYSHEEWTQMLWDNLKNYGPLVYGGSGSSASHAFVCDGYSSNGYFHFNWGWGGKADGYFKLTALAPTSGQSYNDMQNAIFGIRPDEGNCHIDDLEVIGEIRIGKPFEVNFTVYNPNDYPIDAEVLPIFHISDPNNFIGYGTSTKIHLEKEQKPTKIKGTFELVESPDLGFCWMSFGVRIGDKIINKYHNDRFLVDINGPDPASVDNILFDEEVTIEYYDLQGRKVDAGNMLPGVYVKHTVSALGRQTEKIIIK